MRKKALNQEEREILVINWFQIRIQHDNENVASMYEIAKGIGMSPSSHLTRILLNMVDKGTLEVRPLNRNGRFEDSRGYMLKSGTFQRVPKQQRTIQIKSKFGVEQMEMF